MKSDIDEKWQRDQKHENTINLDDVELKKIDQSQRIDDDDDDDDGDNGGDQDMYCCTEVEEGITNYLKQEEERNEKHQIEEIIKQIEAVKDYNYNLCRWELQLYHVLI